MNCAFLGGAEGFGAGPAALNGGGLRLAACCGAGGGALALPPGVPLAATPAELFSLPGLDMAAIALPPREAFKAALLALERGLHVFCAPPFCRSSGELQRLLEASERAGRVLFPSQPWEREPAAHALETALTRGLAGEVSYASLRLELPGEGPAEWLDSGPAWQALSLLLGAFRRRPAAIEARLLPGASAAFHVHFGAGDGFAHIAAGPARRRRLRMTVSGSAGELELDGASLLATPGGERPRPLAPNPRSGASGDARDWLRGELAAFSAEVSGTAARGSGLRNAAWCVRLLKNAGASVAMRSAAIPL